MEDELRPQEQAGHVSTLEALRWAFQATGFATLGKGALLSIIPLVGPFALMGWAAETHRRLVRGDEPAIQDFRFDSFGRYMQLGLGPFLIQMLVGVVLTIPMTALIAVMAVLLPVATLSSDGSPNMGVFAAIMVVTFALILVGIFASLLVTKPMQIRVEISNDFNKAFDLHAVFSFLKRQWRPMLVHSILLSLLSLPLIMLGFLACYVGLFFVAAALQFAQLHLRWQIYEHDIRSGGTIIPLAEDAPRIPLAEDAPS